MPRSFADRLWMRRPPTRAVILSPRLGGADGISAVTRQVRLALAERYGAERVEIWTLGEDPAMPADPAGSKLWTAEGSQRTFALHAAADVTRCYRDAIVVVMHAGLSPAALPLMFRGGRLVVFLHGVEIWKPLGALDAFTMQRAWKLVANSRDTVRRFKQANPAFQDSTVEVCHLGCPTPATFEQTHSSDPPFALIVGRIESGERYKGHDLLLELWPQVIAQVPAARLKVAGGGDDLPRLQAKAESLEVAGHVDFLGRVSSETLAGLYRDCAVFTMPSTGEGFGLVFVEAMLAGKPCIGGPGAAAEIIEHDRTGYIVDPARPQDALTALTRLLDEPELRKSLGESGRQRAHHEFTDERFRQRFLAAVEPTT